MRGDPLAARDGAESVGPGSHHRELVSQPGQAPPRYPLPQQDRGSGSSWNDRFRRFARWSSDHLGSSPAFLAAVAIVVVWALTGPAFDFSETWQLVINTGTTIVTFLMVFLIQNSQNRETKALHLKIDELLRAVRDARTNLVNLENKTDEELSRVAEEFEELGREGDEVPPGTSR
jgi:low affinity Fe/Cu permease